MIDKTAEIYGQLFIGKKCSIHTLLDSTLLAQNGPGKRSLIKHFFFFFRFDISWNRLSGPLDSEDTVTNLST